MNEDEFLAHVRERASLGSTDEAQAATEATLRVLGSRLSGDDAERLAVQLPDSFEAALTEGSDTGAETFGAEAFVERVGERQRVDPTDAERHAKAVTSALNDFVLEEADGVRDRLPDGYDRLFDPPGPET